MINDLKSMAIFAEVIKQGSFRKAGHVLSLSPSVISYHITQLEEKMGSALIYRSTRKLTLSHEGELFYQQVLKMLDAASQGIELLSRNLAEPNGEMSLSLPTALSNSPLNHKIAQFALKYPKVKLDISYSDTRTDIIDKQVDLTIRAGDLKDSDFKSVKLDELKRILVCSPEFYRRYTAPHHPSELADWQWLKLAQLPNNRLFLSDEVSIKVQFDSQITVNSVEAIYQYCLKGVGLAALASSQVKEAIASKQLVHVLEKWQLEPLPLYAIWARNIPKESIVMHLLNELRG
jgi:DNA-binding transcriptional LysR family regulator